MRIGLARFKYDDSGGAEKSLLLLAQGLMERGHDVHVVTTNWQGDRPEGLQIHYAFVDKTPPKAQLKDWVMAAKVEMSRCKVQTYMSLDRIPGSPVIRAGDGCHAAWLARRSVYCSALKRWSFAANPKHRSFLDLERRTFGAPELRMVIANSHMVADELQHYYGLGAAKISVVYNGVDEEHLGPRADAETRRQARAELALNGPALLFLGSGFERKGLEFAIKALPHLPQTELLVVGKDRIGRYKRLSQKTGVCDRVRFMGKQSGIAALLAAADAMVLPTIYDPCSNACLEALWAGLPVVTTRGNGASELIEPGLSGYVIDRPEQQQQLAQMCAEAMQLDRNFPNNVPTMGQWLDQTIAVLEDSVSEVRR